MLPSRLADDVLTVCAFWVISWAIDSAPLFCNWSKILALLCSAAKSVSEIRTCPRGTLFELKKLNIA